MRLNTFKTFTLHSEPINLNENVQAAKSFIQKYYAERIYRKSREELTPEEIQKAFDDRNYKEVLELTKKNPGYTYPFVRFRFDQGITVGQGTNLNADGQIRNLFGLMRWLKERQSLISRLPKTIEEYANEDPAVSTISGFERLTDAIRTLERNLSAKWLVDNLPVNPRNEFRNLTPEDQQELYNLANVLDQLDKDDDKKTITRRLLDKIKAMENYPIQKIIDYITEYVGGYNTVGMDKKIEDVKNLSPEAGILYFKSPYLALSIRNERAQKKLCSIANWCINRGMFSSYAANGIQINIFNYGLSAADPMFLTGTTIRYTGEVNTSHDLNDKHIMWSKNPEEHFLSLGYPKIMVQEIIGRLNSEIQIKKILEKILGKSVRGKSTAMSGKENILSSLFGLASNKIQGDIPEQEWIEIVGVVTDIFKSGGIISPEEIYEFFMENGIFSLSILGVFNDIIRPFISKENMDKIYQSTQEIFDQVERLQQNVLKQGGESDPIVAKTQKILNNKDLILDKVKQMVDS
jgi:hypothetical protein